MGKVHENAHASAHVAHMSARVRADLALVRAGLCPTRARAQAAIAEGRVSVSGAPVTRPGQQVDPAALALAPDPADRWVSRGARKLDAALDRFGISPAGLACLDLGASTGGFTQVLLERGAASVLALDVGHAQLAPEIAADPRVTSREGVNARDLTAADLPRPPDLIVADLSFISLTLALPPALSLSLPGARLVALVKPQFEAGRDALARGGIVRDPAARAAALARVREMLAAHGWRVLGEMESPIPGGDGNIEYLVAAAKEPSA